MKKILIAIILGVVLLSGCMGPPVREPTKLDLTVPVGRIEDNQFEGIRYPFKVSAPPGWKVTMEPPAFMESLGYDREGLKESQVFVYNPMTESNLQIDFTPAGRYSKFSQETIEWLTTAAMGSFKEELEKDYGKDINAQYGPTTAYPLKGVSYSAKKYATYTLHGVKREQGWIYGFTEPYQIFILYMVVERQGPEQGAKDREDLKKILDSFDVFSKK